MGMDKRIGVAEPTDLEANPEKYGYRNYSDKTSATYTLLESLRNDPDFWRRKGYDVDKEIQYYEAFLRGQGR